jgi:aminodeoxyfutalosine synthase
MEGMSGMTLDDARALLEETNLITVGARGDEERRRRHGVRTTFVRVFEVHGDAIPAGLPASARAGEIRIVGKPTSIEAAAASVKAARAMAGATPISGYSLADLLDLAGESTTSLADALRALASAGLQIVAEAPLDLLPDPVAAIRAAHEAGLQVPRLTVHRASDGDSLDLLSQARSVQAAAGGIRAFAPLARVSSVAQPSTGYDDVRLIAAARLVVDNIASIQVDWALYGPKLAQFALTVGADDVDAVSPLEGDLGRRRSPLEEIRGNIRAAGLEPIERDGSFAAIGQ